MKARVASMAEQVAASGLPHDKISRAAGKGRTYVDDVLQRTHSVPLDGYLSVQRGIRVLLAERDGHFLSSADKVNAPVEKPLGKSRIREYDIRPTEPGGELIDMCLITERPVLKELHVATEVARIADEPVAISVIGDGMSPLYKEGDTVLVDAAHRIPSPNGVYVIWDGYSHTLQRIQVLLGTKPLMVRVFSDNPGYESRQMAIADLRVAGRVIRNLSENSA